MVSFMLTAFVICVTPGIGALYTMAPRLGELQAQMMHLDGLGEHLAKVAGLTPQELPSLQSGEIPGWRPRAAR